MTTKIEIIGAVFKCQNDEDIFYQKLSEITGIQKIITKDSKLLVSVSSAQKNQAINDVCTICDFWHASFSIVSVYTRSTSRCSFRAKLGNQHKARYEDNGYSLIK